MKLYLTTGNIGSGKTLIAGKLAKTGAVRVNNDEITTMVQGGEYGAYDPAKKEVYRAIETAGISAALSGKFDIVVDRTNMKRSDRARYIEIGKRWGAKIVSIDFGPGDQHGLARRLREPNGIPSDRWQDVWENFYVSYEQPEEKEGFDSIILGPTKFKAFAIDFDGTICENAFPDFGPPIEPMVDKIRDLYRGLENIIIVWTCRSGEDVLTMRRWLIQNGVPFDAVNYNPVFETGSRKMFAHEYFDDRSTAI
jgi:predicted kinase